MLFAKTFSNARIERIRFKVVGLDGDVEKCNNDGRRRFSDLPYGASEKGHEDRLKVQTAVALDAGGDFIKCSNNGCFWICIAAQNGQAGCLKTRKLLLASRADPGPAQQWEK
jgi:hypothetical protein